MNDPGMSALTASKTDYQPTYGRRKIATCYHVYSDIFLSTSSHLVILGLAILLLILVCLDHAPFRPTFLDDT